MALWPFRRKSIRKRFRSGAAFSDNEVPPLRTQADAGLIRSKSKKARAEPAKLQPRQRTYSFSPGRHDSVRIERARGNTEGKKRGTQGHNSSSGPAADWDRTPTLHLTRRKSSKRRREDHDREAEIKAMSAFMPVPSAMESHGRSRSKQSTKRAKMEGLEHQRRHPSQTSLVYPNSIRSAMSADSDFFAYKLSAFDSLAPRPTLKYSSSTRRVSSRSTASGMVEQMRRPLGDREPIQEDPLDSRKRIDDLADDLDARDLRELMERDNRRRERKRLQDQERLEKKLARRAERNRREEAEARKSGSPPPENLERGVMGREMVGLGIEPPSTVVTSSKRREPDTIPRAPEGMDDVRRTPPLEIFHRPESSPTNDDTAPSETKPRSRLLSAGRTEVGETVSALPEGSSRLAGFLHSKKSYSKSTLGSDKDRLMDEDSGRKNSVCSTKASNRLSFTSFLKWGSKGKRCSGPSSFSNTSREEMPASATPQNAAQAEALAKLQGDDTPNHAYYPANKSASAVPKRTKSRFREDLPDFPLSPPDSRVQSPEADPSLPVVAEQTLLTPPPLTPPLGHDASRSAEQLKADVHNQTHLSMSLASIDSEGSWLSGRVGSSKAPKKQSSLARISRRDMTYPSDSPTNSTVGEELVMADDEYLSYLASGRNSGATTGTRLFVEGRSSSDGNESMVDDSPRWGRVGARPQVIECHHHDREAMRSRQGLLNIDSGDEEDTRVLTHACPV
ncbi:hypothetical protein E4U42_007739 [Claviceps africana]|uniref:Uncharacterized protein n=1 Tax=Claviceps africana TaxID=83212 RepID=A0A8K0J0T0_9HYPO|nr:hypothetical protein E4U42_007739 [Claviceps africana]